MVTQNLPKKVYNYLINSKAGNLIEPFGALIQLLSNYSQNTAKNTSYGRKKKSLEINSNEKVIVVISRSFLENRPNGVKNWLESIALGFSRNPNIKVVVLTQNSVFFSYVVNYKNLQVVSIPFTRNLRFEKLTYAKSWSKSAFDFVAKNRLDRKDVFIVGTLAGLEMMSLDSLKNAKPVVLLVTPGGFDQENDNQVKNFHQIKSRAHTLFLAEKYICNFERAIMISDSWGLLRDLESYFEIQLLNRSHVVHIGHIQDSCSVEESNRSLLYFGPLRWRKGADVLPALLNQIKENFPDWTLTVATSGGELFDVLESLVKMENRGLLNLSIKPNEQTRHDLMRRASVLLIPSRYESFGMVAAEGIAHGAFIISTNIGGIPEVVRSDGVLSDEVTPESFYRAFLKATDESNHTLEKRSQRAVYSRDYFSPHRMMNEISLALNIEVS
jgi:glycosyltransferase involved in cell wall biosynthesis